MLKPKPLSTMRSTITILLAMGVVATLVLSAVPAGAQDQGSVRIIGSGGSDELGPPPSPRCDDLVFITEVSFDAEGNPIDIPRFGSSPDLTQVFDVPDFAAVGPGLLVLDEVIVYDGHIGRALWTPQLMEQVYFELLLGGVQQVITPLTPDVPDGQRTGWHDVDMGTYELPNGADTLRIHHVGGDPANVESLVVSALCGHLEPFPDVTPDVTVAPTTIAPSTTVPTTVASTTPVPTTAEVEEIETEVESEVEEPVVPALAVTGRTAETLLLLGVLALALGVSLVQLSSNKSAS
jgi:hypothetical protein